MRSADGREGSSDSVSDSPGSPMTAEAHQSADGSPTTLEQSLLERRRQRNRESMRRVRRRKRDARVSSQQTVEQLEKQLERMVAQNQQKAEVLALTDPTRPSEPSSSSPKYAELLAETAALSVENRELRAQVHNFQEVEAGLARLVAARDSYASTSPGKEGGDEEQSVDGEELLKPLLSWLDDDQLLALMKLATAKIFENAALVESLVPRGNMALGWLDQRCVDHPFGRYLLHKKFPNASAKVLLDRTWRATTNMKELATVMRWANGMKVLRWLSDDAAIVTRELAIPNPNGSELPTRFRFTLLVFRCKLRDGFLIGTTNLNVYGTTVDECLAKDVSFHRGVNAHTLYGWVFKPIVDPRTGRESGCEVTLAGLTGNGSAAYAHNVLMEMITVALLWENAFVGQILRLTNSI